MNLYFRTANKEKESDKSRLPDVKMPFKNSLQVIMICFVFQLSMHFALKLNLIDQNICLKTCRY